MKIKLLIGALFALFLMGAGNVSLAVSSLDAGFNPGSGVNGFVEFAVVQPDNKILICGNFTTFNGVARKYIARLYANGSLDTSFNASPSYWVRNMALQPDGKIIIGGFFNDVGGVARKKIARLNADGSLDTTFNPGSGFDGKIVPVDPTDPFVFAVRLQSDGKIIVGGNFTNYNGVGRIGVARLNANGSLDTTFNVGSGVDSWVRNILIAPNGQIYLSGWFTSYNNQPYNRMVRLNANGSADTTFNPFFGDKTAVYSMVYQSDGKLIVAGHSVSNNTPFYPEVRRLNTNGSYDSTFNPGGRGANEKVESVILQSDGKIYIAGYFTYYNGVERRGLARLNSNGTLDTNFTATADNWIWTLVRQSNGKILVCGGYSTIDGVSRHGIARLNTAAQGSLAGWLMNGVNFAATSSLRGGSAVDVNWKVIGTGDFNADGKEDFILQYKDGRLSAWFMNGTAYLKSGALKTPPSGWRGSAVGDLNNDGKSDIVWRTGSGQVAVWLMNGTNIISSQLLRNGYAMATNWHAVAVRDMNVDGHSDLIWQDNTGRSQVWVMNGTNFQSAPLLRSGQSAGAGWTMVGAGNFNADTRTDLVWQHTDGRVAVWFMNGLTYTSTTVILRSQGAGWRVVGVPDFNKDGKSDLLWRYLSPYYKPF